MVNNKNLLKFIQEFIILLLDKQKKRELNNTYHILLIY